MARTLDRTTIMGSLAPARKERKETFAEIDAKALQRARRDPVVQRFAAEADAHLEQLREEGRID